MGLPLVHVAFGVDSSGKSHVARGIIAIGQRALGFLSIGMAFAGILYALIIRLYTNDWVRGWTSIFTAVLFIGGAQLVTLGIIGEYIGRIYAEVKRRPLYVIEERLGFDKAATEPVEPRERGQGRGPRRGSPAGETRLPNL